MSHTLKENLLLVFSTLYNNNINKKRRDNLIYHCKINNIPFIANEGIIDNDKMYITYKITMDNLLTAKNSNYKYCIITQDDFEPISNFIDELQQTIDVMPDKWRALHLCPGFLWGRKYRDTKKIGKLNSHSDLSQFKYKNPRYFQLSRSELISIKGWLGGPVAALINNEYIDSYINDFDQEYKKKQQPDDVIHTNIISPLDFIAREPQLGYENEQGGTTLFKKITWSRESLRSVLKCRPVLKLIEGFFKSIFKFKDA